MFPTLAQALTLLPNKRGEVNKKMNLTLKLESSIKFPMNKATIALWTMKKICLNSPEL